MDYSELVRECNKDYELFASAIQKIKTDFTAGKRKHLKETSITPFILTRTQKHIVNKLKSSNRMIILKARRKGISTLCEGLIDWRTRLNVGQHAYIIAHEGVASENLFDTIRLFYNHSPKSFQPKYKTFNRQHIYYGNPDMTGPPGLESQILNHTAANPNLGASFAVHFIHFSEISRYESAGCNVRKMMESLLPTVPDRPDCFIIMESTAEQGGAYFKDKWYSPGNYEKVFLSWISDDTNRAELLSKDQYPKNISDAENSHYGDEQKTAELIRKELEYWYPELTGEEFEHEVYCRLSWRRHVIDDRCLGDRHVFERIYPLTPEEAFAAEGHGFFHPYILSEEKQILKDNPPECVRKRFDSHCYENYSSQEWWRQAFFPATYGPLEVFEESQEGCRYVIGADPAQGLHEGDPSAAIVLKLPELVEVATWCGQVEPDVFSELLYALGMLYNKALLGCETNGVGFATQMGLMKKLRYPRLYSRRKTNLRAVTEYSAETGWFTTETSKSILLTDLKSKIAHREILLNSLRTIEHLEDFRELSDGTLGVWLGKHDDLVIALGIAIQMANVTHISTGRTPKKVEYGSLDWWKKQADAADSWQRTVKMLGGSNYV